MFPIFFQETQIKNKILDNFISVAIGETQGWRQQMEDATVACFVENNGQLDLLFAVFDGHGGQEVSIFCTAVFPTILEFNIK